MPSKMMPVTLERLGSPVEAATMCAPPPTPR